MSTQTQAEVPRGWTQRALRMLERTACVVRRVIGAPDYERYVSHLRERHPDLQPVSRDEFMRQRLADRYNRPGTRCC